MYYEMAKKQKADHPSQFLNDLTDWQEHQYDPGRYLGGNLPPQLKYASENKSGKALSIVYIIVGIISTLMVITPILFNVSSNISFIGLAYSLLLLIAGLGILLKHRRSKK